MLFSALGACVFVGQTELKDFVVAGQVVLGRDILIVVCCFVIVSTIASVF